MSSFYRAAARIGFVFTASTAATGVALADAQTPTISGDGWVALGAIAVLVVIIWLVIRGTLSVADSGETASDDSGVLPFFGGDDEDEDKPKRKR